MQNKGILRLSNQIAKQSSGVASFVPGGSVRIFAMENTSGDPSEEHNSSQSVDGNLSDNSGSSIGSLASEGLSQENEEGASDWTFCEPSETESNGQSEGDSDEIRVLDDPLPQSSSPSTLNSSVTESAKEAALNRLARLRRISQCASPNMCDPMRKRGWSSVFGPPPGNSHSSDDESDTCSGKKLKAREVKGFTKPINHCKHLYNDLAELWKSKEFSDIEIQCSDGDVKAHKLIVSARSEVFRAMFGCAMAEASSNTVKIEDIKLDVMKILLEYMYTGCVAPLPIEEMSDLLRAADKYQLNPLKTSCFKVLIRKLTLDNAAELVMLAHIHNASDEVKLRIQEYILRMRVELWKIPQFKVVMEENPKVFATIVFEQFANPKNYRFKAEDNRNDAFFHFCGR